MTKILFVLSFLASTLAQAAVLPSGFSESTLASGLTSPTAMAFAPDGRLFVAEQGGKLRVVRNRALLPTPFVDIVVNSTGERGLLGVAFDPGFALNHWVYVYYTATTPVIHNRVSRFTALGDVAVAGSEVVIADLETLSATNHNGGAIHFGPDGYLYVAVGDNATGANAQTLSNRLGKMLRIGADGSIPADNPFYGTATGLSRSIWALGLRNPYTFAFQPGTGGIFINDVGQDSFEEINLGVAGANYGWPATEGVTMNPLYRSPVHAYAHAGSVCAISGGAFYDAAAGTYPASYDNAYFFADFCAGWVQRIDATSGAATGYATGFSLPVDLASGPDGNLFVLARGAGTVQQVTYCSGTAPVLASISPTSGPVGSLAVASGSGFVSGTRMEFDVVPTATQALSADLIASVPGLPPGPTSVRVVTPGGCRSNAIPFTVANAASCGLLGVEPLLALALLGGARRLRVLLRA